MIYILAITILLLMGVIVFQMALFARSRRRHEQKMEVLRQVVVELANSNAERQHQVRLSDELLQKLRKANVAISHDIASMVKDFVDTLSRNDLLE